MADENYSVAVTDNINKGIEARLLAIAAAAEKAENNLDILRASLSMLDNVAAFTKVTSSAQLLSKELKAVNSSAKAITGTVNGNAAALLKADKAALSYAAALAKANATTLKISQTSNNLKSNLGGLAAIVGTAFSFSALIQASDRLTSLQNALKVTGLEGEALATVQEHLFQTANKNGQAVNDLAGVYRKASISAGDLGASQQDILNFTDAVAAGLKIQGGAAAESSGALRQLGQAISSARVQSEEFNSILDGALPIAQAAARGIEQFHGSVAALTTFIKNGGTITGKQLFNAIIDGLGDMEKQALKANLTIGQSVTVLENQLAKFTSSTTAGARALSQAILFIGDNLNIIIPIVAALGIAWATVKLFQITKDIYDLVKGIILWTAENILLNASLIPTIIAFAEFTLGLIAGLAALYAVAALVAALTGNLDAFNGWIVDTAANVVKFTSDILGIGATAQAVSPLNDAVATLSGNSNQAATSVASVRSETQSFTGAVNDNTDAQKSNVQSIVQSIDKFTALSNAIHATWQQYEGATKAAKAFNDAGYAAARNNGGTFNDPNSSFSFVDQAPSSLTDTITDISKPKTFATGGSFPVGGKGGVDKNLVQFYASNDERVDILTPAQQRAQKRAMSGAGAGGGTTVMGGSTYVTMNVQTTDANSFKRSRGQVSRDLQQSMRSSR